MSYKHREYREDGTFWVSAFRDDDTRTVTTYDESGNVTATRPYTEAENAAADAAAQAAALQANAVTLTTDAGTDLPKIEQAIADTLALLGPNDQAGSIRHHRTTVLTNQYSVGAQRAQDDLILSLAVVVRRLSRQVARLTRLQAGYLDTANVGEDAT